MPPLVRPEEQVVAYLVELVLPGARMEPIAVQSNGEHDYNLCIDGMVFPFEVTRATSRTSTERARALDGTLGSRRSVQRKDCRHDWIVELGRRSRVNAVCEQIDALLSQVERDGLDDFSTADADDTCPSVLALRTQLHIVWGQRLLGAPKGEIVIVEPSESASLSPDCIADAVMHEIQKADNLRKLRAVDAKESHIGVYIDERSYPAHAAIQYGYRPEQPLDLPDGITHVWIVARTGPGETHVVVCFSRERGWTDYGRHHGRSTAPPAT
jgi:hypothetical protein